MDKDEDTLTYKWEKPIGNINYPREVRITEEGMMFDNCFLLDWEWIDNARKQLKSSSSQMEPVEGEIPCSISSKLSYWRKFA